ncbi:MAG: cytidine deaminase [Nanoarchaeota archaeon]
MKKEVKGRLIQAAIQASVNAFHPLTPVGVGAAVLTCDGDIFRGCNVQTTISGLGVCAERCAIYSAVASGNYIFDAVAVYFPSQKFIKPCGVCLQLIYEFAEVADRDIHILLINKDRRTRLTSVRRELKDAYGPRTAGKNISPYLHNHHE